MSTPPVVGAHTLNVAAAYYPDFVLYPSIDQDITANLPNFDSPATNSPKPVGLIQPKGTAFTHHG